MAGYVVISLCAIERLERNKVPHPQAQPAFDVSKIIEKIGGAGPESNRRIKVLQTSRDVLALFVALCKCL